MRYSTRILHSAVCAFAAIVLAGNSADAQSKEDSRFKVTAVGGPMDDSGKQTVTVKFDIAPGCYIYANPVQNVELETVKTVVKVSAAGKAANAVVHYPPGKLRETLGFQWMVYEGQIEITVVVQRAPGDVGPLDVDVFFQKQDGVGCYFPSRVRLK